MFPNIAIITLDSCRYDTWVKARTPNLDKFGQPERCYSMGVFTAPTHLALFQFGFGPVSYEFGSRYYYRDRRLFKIENDWNKDSRAWYELPPDAPNIVKGFEELGYHTVGIGGVSQFDNRYDVSRCWNQFFDEFYWEVRYNQNNPDALESQIMLIRHLGLFQYERVFLFLNSAATHYPYRDGEKSLRGQIAALEYVDRHLPEILADLPRPLHLFVFGDHGECFGERIGNEQVYGHKIAHHKVMEVGCIDVILED